ERLHEEDKTADLYLIGRKAQAYFDFRNRPYKGFWTGSTDSPDFDTAKEIGETLVEAFLTDYEDGGVDEIHIVYTEFKSMVNQEPMVIRLLPLEFVDEKLPMNRTSSHSMSTNRPLRKFSMHCCQSTLSHEFSRPCCKPPHPS